MALPNSGASGRDLLGLIKAQDETARSTRTGADTIPALTRRVSELEAHIRTLEAELDAERRQRGAETVSQRSLETALADVRLSIDAIRDEQRKVADEIESVRRSALGAVLPPAGPPPSSIDLPTPAADDARALLDELLSTAAEPAAPVIEPATPAIRALCQIQIVISSIHSFPRLLAMERRIASLSSVIAMQLRDFGNGVATFSVSVSEAISPAEFGAVLQMLESLHLRLEGSTPSSVELRAMDDPPAS